MSEVIQLGLGIIIISILLIYSQNNTSQENFSSEVASIGAMPKNTISSASGLPLFLNFYPRFGQDFRLSNLIQKLKINKRTPMPNGIYDPTTGKRSLYESKKLPPIILVPGLGASPLYSKWNKSSVSTVQVADEDFQQPSTWSCKQVQNEWTQIWPPNKSGLASTCWADTISVSPSNNKIINSEGTDVAVKDFGQINFANPDYMDTLVDAFEAAGYQQGVNLFAVPYDFRKIGDPIEIDMWCLSVSKMIEQNCALQQHRAIIIGHDLGSVVANYFLVGSLQNWKDKFIDKFISISGTFGGCPKALRKVLAGEPVNFSKAIRNMSGLSLLLPNPKIYGDRPLLLFNNVTYTSKDIGKLISTEANQVLAISEKVRNTSMNAPGVEVHVLAGTDINTENFYKYDMALDTEPEKNIPFYQLELPFDQKFYYDDYYNGDGTMPKFALEYPIWWSKKQMQPVYFQFFTGCEHTKILSTLEPVRYILENIGAI